MPFRPTPACRRNVRGVILPLTEALRRLYGARATDGALPLGAFYTINIDSEVWQPAGGIWYRAVNMARIEGRNPNDDVVEQFVGCIESGVTMRLPSGTIVSWEAIPESEASALPPVAR